MNPTTMPQMPIMSPMQGLALGPIGAVMDMLPFLFLLVYMAPAIVAILRKSSAAGSVFLLNLFLGWTVIGWLAALVWSYLNCKGACAAPALAPAAAAPVHQPARGWWHLPVKITGITILVFVILMVLMMVVMPVSETAGTATRAPAITATPDARAPEGVPLPAEELFGK